MATKTREQIKKPTRKKKVETAPEEEKQLSKTEKHDEAVAAIDAVLDEIDEVLEHDAYEFVKGYIQAGGE